ncbi:MAG: DUF2321 domain-containing protein [Rhodospirillales bacterium]|nr:DUF2321 domain-containing protein [Rhodospirillales bacterium]MBN8907514.1 DUF2321 domain-containing protein [Rhodospirillales bacterium]MBN8925060.1 DUF2321 domain-containing protein [Rhodospirillales bacterium]
MSSSGYDVQQVCLNGHQITPSARTNPHLTKPRCPCCGEKTIMACPTCDAPIRGRCRVHGVVATRRIPVPTHCHACGAAYPWRRSAIVAAIAALETELGGRIPSEVIALIWLIGAETARTEMAALQLRRMLRVLGQPAYDTTVKLVADVTSETARTILQMKQP